MLNTSATAKHCRHLESTNRPSLIVHHIILRRFLLLSRLRRMLFQRIWLPFRKIMSICNYLDRFLPLSTVRRVSPTNTNKYCALVGIIGLLQLMASTAVVAACLCTYTPATLVEVLDGNTIILKIKGESKTVHLAGIDTPGRMQGVMA